MKIPTLLLGLALVAAPAAAQDASEPDLAELRERIARSQELMRREGENLRELARQLADEALSRSDWQAALAPRPRLGVVLGEDEGAGLRIAAVTPDGPAAQAGLQAGDRLLEIGGRSLAGGTRAARLAALQGALEATPEGQPVRIDYEREGRRASVDLVPSRSRLAVAPRALIELEHLSSIAPFTAWCSSADDCLGPGTFEALRWRGLRLVALEPKLGRYFGSDVGVLVLSDRDGLLAGLEPGDVILAVDGAKVEDQRQLLAALGRAEPGASLRLDLLRERQRRSLEVLAPARPPAEDLLRRLAPPAPPAPPRPPRAPAPAPAPAPPPPPVTGGLLY